MGCNGLRRVCQRHHRRRHTQQHRRRRLGQLVQTAGARHQPHQPAQRLGEHVHQGQARRCRQDPGDRHRVIDHWRRLPEHDATAGGIADHAAVHGRTEIHGRLARDRHGIDAGADADRGRHRRATAEIPAQVSTQDVAPGVQAGAQGDRRQPARQGTLAPAPARIVAKWQCLCGAQGRLHRHEPDPLCGGHPLRRKDHGRTPGHLQGRRPAGHAHPRSGAQPLDSGAAVADAGARPVCQRRDRSGHSVSLYTAVAQVLAYVYRLRAALRGEAPMPGDPPEPDVPVELDPHSRTAQRAA